VKDHTSCIFCGRSQTQVPILVVYYGDQSAGICPEHLPVLIHQPQKLEGKLPGVENLDPPPHE